MKVNIFFKGHNSCNPLVTQHLISHTCSAAYFTHMVKLYFHIDIKVFILVNLIRIKSLHLLLIFVSVLCWSLCGTSGGASLGVASGVNMNTFSFYQVLFKVHILFLSAGF